MDPAIGEIDQDRGNTNTEDQKMYEFLFESSPVALFEVDYSKIVTMLHELPHSGQSDLVTYFADNPGDVDRFVSAIRILNMNNAALELLDGSKKETFISNSNWTFTDRSRGIFISELMAINEGLLYHESETELLTQKGDLRNVTIRIQINKDVNNVPIYSRVLVAFNDISELFQSNLEMKKEKERAARYLNMANVLFVSMDKSGIVKMANTKLCATLDLPPHKVIGKNWIEQFVDIDEQDVVWGSFNKLISGHSQRAEQIEYNLRSASGKIYVVDWFNTILRNRNGDVVEIVASGVDKTTERILESNNLDMETQLLQSQKLKSISTLASGVAHEINNPLTGLLNYASILADELEDSELREFAQGIEVEGKRVADIVTNLLTFAGTDPGRPQVIGIGDFFDKAVMLISKSLKTDQIILDMSQVDPNIQVNCRVKELQHVILNLLTNSWQAINRKKFSIDEGKRISISSSLRESEETEEVRIIIDDNGDGIKESDIQNVFDPFFSGGSRVRRIGMGLAVAYGIIRDHQGSISIKSKLGVGTQVEIKLPCGLRD